jgi:hypothetical protein
VPWGVLGRGRAGRRCEGGVCCHGGGAYDWGVCVTDKDDDDDASPSLLFVQSQLSPRPREWPPLSPENGKGECV